MKTCKNFGRGRLLLDDLNNAAYGDPVAMGAIFIYYDGYLKKLARKKFYDDDGYIHFYVDDERMSLLDFIVRTTVVMPTIKISYW